MKPNSSKPAPTGNDCFDDKDFDVIRYINQKFPDENSLGNLDTEISKLKGELASLDEEILASVHEHSLMNANIREEIENSTRITKEIVDEISSIKEKAVESENLVYDMCKDIKLLDYAKKNLTISIQMLQKYLNAMDSIESLRGYCEHRNYKNVTNTIMGINDLLTYFKPYQSIPQVKELFRDKDEILKNLQLQILEDYELFFKEQSVISLEVMKDAGELVEVLGSNFRNQLYSLINKLFSIPFAQIFTQPDNHKIESIQKMFTWFNKERRDFVKKFIGILPSYWGTETNIVHSFCGEARIMIGSILEHTDSSKVDVTELLKAMKASVDFEKKIADELRTEYIQYISDKESVLKNALPEFRDIKKDFILSILPPIKGSITNSFEMYMRPYVLQEENDLLGQIKKSWDSDMAELSRIVDPGNDLNKILKSSMLMFNLIKQVLNRANTLSQSQTMFDVNNSVKKVLRNYADEIEKKAQRDDKTIKLKDEGVFEQNLCILINTCDYCKKTITSMHDIVAGMLEQSFSEKLSFDNELDSFTDGVNFCLGKFGEFVTDKLNLIFERLFMKVSWERLTKTGDVSEYVKESKIFLGNHTKSVRSRLDEGYLSIYLYRICTIANEIFINNFCKIKKFNEWVIQQLQLDFFELKMEVINVGKNIENKGSNAGYMAHANKQTQKTENLLKLLAMNNDKFLENFKIFYEDANPQIVEKIFPLKGFKKQEIQMYINNSFK